MFKIHFPSEEDFISNLNCSNIRATKQQIYTKRLHTYESFKYFLGQEPSMQMGELILRMEDSLLRNRKLDPLPLNEILERYKSIVHEIQDQKGTPERFFLTWKAVLKIAYGNDRENIDYCKNETLMSNAF